MECSAIQILRSIESCMFSLRTLRGVEFLRDAQGTLSYRVGNSAVIFNATVEGESICLKCYTSNVVRRKVIYGDKLLEQELYISIDNSCGVWLDVLATKWIVGQPMGDYLKTLVLRCDRDALMQLSQRFDRFALRMLGEEWAHGDISCDNILVDNNLELHLIDYDTSFVKEFEGLESLELGTYAYQHPARTVEHFDSSIDDYSLALISTALHYIALRPEAYKPFVDSEQLLYDPLEILELRSEIYWLTLDLFAQRGEVAAYRVAQKLASQDVALEGLRAIIHYKVYGADLESQSISIFCREGLWGYLSESGREVIPPLYDEAYPFKDSCAAVRIDSTWHNIDTSGRIVDNCK